MLRNLGFVSILSAVGAFAFPETSFGAKDYEEDVSFVPFGYIIMFAWLAIMITAIMILSLLLIKMRET